MQTFLPYPNFGHSAHALDMKRLGKQRVETKQILNALINGGGWSNHPAVRMWRGYEDALRLYGVTICAEWLGRGYRDSMLNFFASGIGSTPIEMPPWFGDPNFHLSHQSNLVRKFPEHYVPQFGHVSPDMEYIWPEVA